LGPNIPACIPASKPSSTTRRDLIQTLVRGAGTASLSSGRPKVHAYGERPPSGRRSADYAAIRAQITYASSQSVYSGGGNHLPSAREGLPLPQNTFPSEIGASPPIGRSSSLKAPCGRCFRWKSPIRCTRFRQPASASFGPRDFSSFPRFGHHLGVEPDSACEHELRRAVL